MKHRNLLDRQSRARDPLQVLGSIAKVTGIMGEMAAASQHRNAGIEQINQAIGEFDQATRQNAALVEQDAGAAESLQQQAHQLARLVAAADHAGAIHTTPAQPVLAQRAHAAG